MENRERLRILNPPAPTPKVLATWKSRRSVTIRRNMFTGWLEFKPQYPYEPFTKELNERIPKEFRTYDKGSENWYVHWTFERLLLDIVSKHFHSFLVEIPKVSQNRHEQFAKLNITIPYPLVLPDHWVMLNAMTMVNPTKEVEQVESTPVPGYSAIDYEFDIPTLPKTERIISNEVEIDSLAEYYRVNEVSRILRVSQSHIYRQVHLGKIGHIRIGKSICIPKSEIERLRGIF